MSTVEPVVGSAVGMELELTRVVRAPRDVVWQAWTDVERLREWWGPKSFTNPRCEIDVRVGGAIRIDMRAPDGTVYPMGGEYEEIAPPKRLVFLSSALDADGDALFTNRNTVVFREVEGGTEVALQVRVIAAKAASWQYLKGMRGGWSSSLDKLAELLKTA